MTAFKLADKPDEGNPAELGALVGTLLKSYKHFNIVGGCCGTDMRHIKCILEAAKISLKISLSVFKNVKQGCRFPATYQYSLCEVIPGHFKNR